MQGSTATFPVRCVSLEQGGRGRNSNKEANVKKLGFALFIVLLTACAAYMSGSKYSYRYALTDPDSPSMTYRDENIQITFAVGDKAINFDLKNLTSVSIKIIWDEASIVQFGEAKRVMHSGIKYIDRNDPQAPTVIPPDARIEDLAMPTENVYFISGRYGGWEEHDLFATRDYGKPGISEMILGYRGVNLILYLPIEMKGDVRNYKFELTITDVRKITE
jgi:hypothetical protein